MKGCRVIILDFETDKLMPLQKILAAKDEQAVVVGCFSADNFSALEENYHLFDDIWIQPFAPEKVQASFGGILDRLKEQEDACLPVSILTR